MDIELLLDAQAELGEGPCWDDREQQLYWVDINAGIIHRTAADGSEDSSISLGEKVGAVVLRENGGLLIATEGGFASPIPPLPPLSGLPIPKRTILTPASTTGSATPPAASGREACR